MPIVGAYPILRELNADGDTVTVKSLKLWLYDYHLEPPKTAVNDNSPDSVPIEWETNIYEYSGDGLVAALEEDEKLKSDPDFEKKLPPYSAEMHGENHHRHVRRTAKLMPVVDVDAEIETIRYIDAKKMRDWLGADADVLDMAVEPNTTFDDIGRHIGADAAEGKQEVKGVAATFYDRVA